jgi:hypothetical protein
MRHLTAPVSAHDARTLTQFARSLQAAHRESAVMHLSRRIGACRRSSRISNALRLVTRFRRHARRIGLNERLIVVSLRFLLVAAMTLVMATIGGHMLRDRIANPITETASAAMLGASSPEHAKSMQGKDAGAVCHSQQV